MGIIFIQAFLARLIPTSHEVQLAAIRYFHVDQYPPNAVVAAIGALCASVILYAIGVLLRRLPERVSTEEQRARIEAVRGNAQHFVPWLLVFAPLPVGAMVIIVAGFFDVKKAKVAVILIAAEALYRAMPYLHS